MTDNIIDLPVQSINSDVDIPNYAYPGDAGFDLKSTHSEIIEPLSRKIIKCGFCMAIPEGFAGLVIPRSGLAVKHGISVVNAPGLVDSGYRGEITVILLNTDKDKSFKVNVGDRIAQMMIVPFSSVNLVKTENLDESIRKNKGFGSSGVKG